jgi:hypothetical protein
VNAQSRTPDRDPPDNDSAVAVLRALEEERHSLFGEAEYRKYRKCILDELAGGARCRPSTLVTFAVVGALLLAGLILGLYIRFGTVPGDGLLALTSTAALGAWGYLLFAYVRGVRREARRTLDARLAELEELRASQLISREEYEFIQAGILSSRQLGGAR